MLARSTILIVYFSYATLLHADAVVDAKRRAATDLMRDGKAIEAVALIQEVIGVEPGNYKDHLLLGRAYDKLNKSSDAVRAYRATLAKLPPTAGGPDERMARAEAERRLKILDQMTAKVRLAEEEFLKKLDLLEREAISARDIRAVDLVFRLKAGVYRGGGRTDAGGIEVLAAGEWQDSGVVVVKGRQYRIRAVGTWDLGPISSCTGDGLPDASTGTVRKGALLSKLGNFGSDPLTSASIGTFTAPETGSVCFISAAADRAQRQKYSGSLFVLIEPLN